MKKIFLLAVCVCLCFTAAFSQNVKSKNNSTPTKNTVTPQKAPTHDVRYMCSKCTSKTHQPGQCPFCKIPLIKDGDFYCATCHTANPKAAKCPKCKKDMTKMVIPE